MKEITISDSEIVRLFCERSERAIAVTEQKYGNLCRHIAGSALANREDIDECVNDTLLALWNSIPPEKPDKLCSYICKITRNLALKKYHHITAQRRNPNMEMSLSLVDYLPDTDDLQSAVEDKETVTYINECLRKLSFNDRNIFLRKYFFGDSTAKIAVTFKFSESKVKSSLHRTRGKLKTYLINKGVQL